MDWSAVPHHAEGDNDRRSVGTGTQSQSVPFFTRMTDEEYLSIYKNDGSASNAANLRALFEQRKNECPRRGYVIPQSPLEACPPEPGRQPYTPAPWGSIPHEAYPVLGWQQFSSAPLGTIPCKFNGTTTSFAGPDASKPEKDPYNMGVFLEADDYFAACDRNTVTEEDLQGIVKHRLRELAKAENVPFRSAPFSAWNLTPDSLSPVSVTEQNSVGNGITSKEQANKQAIVETEKDHQPVISDHQQHQPLEMDWPTLTKTSQGAEQRENLGSGSGAKFHQRQPTPGLLFPTTPESAISFPWDNNTSGPKLEATGFHGHGGGRGHSPSNSHRKRNQREFGSGASRREHRPKQPRRGGYTNQNQNEAEVMCIHCLEAGRPNDVVRSHTMLDVSSGRLHCKFLTGEFGFK